MPRPRMQNSAEFYTVERAADILGLTPRQGLEDGS